MTADRATAFKAALGDLNAQFASWVVAQASSSPHALWCDGARDYCRHAAALVAEFSDALAGAGSSAAAAPAAPLFGAAFGGTASPPPPAFGGGGGLFGAPAPAAGGGLFGAPAGGGGGLFGAPPAGGGLFGAPAAAPAGGLFGAPAPFSFGSTAPAAPTIDEGADDDDSADDGGSPTAAAIDASSSITFKEKAKLYAQGADKKWAERGSGTLTLRAPVGGRPHVVLTTDTGRVPLNAGVYKGMQALKAKKPHLVTVALANAAAPRPSDDGGGGAPPPPASAPKLEPHLFNLGTEAAADAFIAALKAAAAA